MVTQKDLKSDLIKASAFETSKLVESAWIGHNPFANWLILNLNPKVLVELGTHNGNSFFAFCQSVLDTGSQTRCCAVDTWEGDEHAGNYNNKVYEEVLRHIQSKYSVFSELIRASFDSAVDRFEDGTIDLLHIDGLHTYEAVKHDFETWRPKLSQTGVILFHDTCVRDRGFGVWKLWSELTSEYPNYFEFTHSYGLGVLSLDKNKRIEVIQKLHEIKKNHGDIFSVYGQHQCNLLELQRNKLLIGELNALVDGRTAQISERDQWLLDAKIAIEERDMRLIEFAREMEQKLTLHQKISEAITQSENQIDTLEALSAEREGHLEKFQEVILAKDSRISAMVKEQEELNHSLGERDDKIGVLRESLVQQCSRINQPSGTIDQLSEVISERNNKIEEFSKIISSKDEEIGRWTGEMSEMEKRMISLERRMIEKDNTIRNLMNQVSASRAATPELPLVSLTRLTFPLELLRESLDAIKKRLRRYALALRTHADHRESGVFDHEWYLGKNPDVRASGMNPWRHFLFFGISENRSPRCDFQPEAYLRLNADVAASHLGPVEHYMSFGWKEGRSALGISDSYQSVQESISAWVNHYRPQLVHLDKSKKTVLLVTHEISRTGAPILVLNLAEKLRKYYTVIVLSMGGGTLFEEFTNACDLVIGPLMGEQGRHEFLSGFFRGLQEIHPIDCAVVNSIVSTPILKPLWENDIPASHLIHEFSSYTRPETTFNESAFYSAKQIFSSRLILENALQDYPKLALKSPIVIPQGRCNPPLNQDNRVESEEERFRLGSLLRPSGSPDNLFVVIGLGTVQLRKGVDLFLECAHKVSKLQSKVPIRFVWFGHGYDVKLDGEYSVYLHDQMKRSGIEHMCKITHETDQLDHVYDAADLLFLSSRLDPLPLVSQDMMAHGKPVLCFEKATGLAEFLVDDPTVRDCVIDYMDVEGAASRIVELANDHTEYQRVGKALNAVLEKTFNLDSYAERIHEHCEELMPLEESKREDHDIIRESGLLDEKYFRHPAVSDRLGVKAYMALWSTGLDHRKPFAGFHPGIYAERNGVSQRDPLAEYIRKGKPVGPWVQEVISPERVTDEDLKKTLVPTALHLHLYYPEMADSILARVVRCKSRPDLLISVGDQESLIEVEQSLRKYELQAARIAIVPNRGRDIGPLLTEFGRDIIDHYEIVGHLHSKKTKRIEDQRFVEEWVNFLFGNLLGNQEPMMDAILKRMGEDPSIGLIYADDPYVMGWGSNEMLAQELLRKLKVPIQIDHQNISFPIGTMFWGRTKALLPLLGLNLDWEDYPEEPLPHDGTILHAIERILPIISENRGFKTLKANTPNLTR
jgi:glycosyltransferase involved in cell wall biosynthesis